MSEPASTSIISSPPTHVVGVGASAGGLEAIERLFRSIPVDTGMAFVIVQHLSPDFKSLMDELLSRWTTMPVHRVDDGMQVIANNIYLIPPKMEITIEADRLHLVCKKPEEGLSLPIDVFFESLAKQWETRGIAVVLSGTGSDGSRGIRKVHEAGGLVISQSLETAKFDGMPKSAEKTGVVDMVLSPEDIAGTLELYASFPVSDKTQLLDVPVVVDETSMRRLLRLLREECGIDFVHYKEATVVRRIERRVLLSQALDFEDYVERVSTDREELNALYKDLLIGVTHFFRDPGVFDRLRNEVLPKLLRDLEPGDQFRAWIAGCATGEEAYSFAIIVSEILEDLNLQLDVKIFATDVHRASLDVAGAGIYSEQSLADISSERKRRFFLRTASGYQMTPEVRQMIVFAPHNVIVDAPFTKLDFVSCRNMLIYFQPDAQSRVISLFHFSLKKSGVLLLGPSETLGELANEFNTIDGHWKIYRKVRDIRLPRELTIGSVAETGPDRVPMRLTTSVLPRAASESDLVTAYDQLLNVYMPAGVLLDSQRRLVHLFGNAIDYVQLRPGRPSNDSLDLFAPQLRAAAAGALHRASRELKPVHFSGLRINDDEDTPAIRMGVQPLLSKDGELSHFMITFEPVEIPSAGESTELSLGEVSSDRMVVLERELHVMRDNLQTTIEELETSNEELQATNEELVASNEELQSTNEELHSVNEELYTVNGEYQKKIVELTELTDDLNHLFENLDAGLLFLDSELNVRKFTPSMASIFSLLPQDVGRSMRSFTHCLERPTLIDDVQSVLETRKEFRKEIRSKDGQWYLLRIQPYRSRGRVDGVVLELFEVTHLKRTRGQLRRRVSQLQTAMSHAGIPIAVKDPQGKYLHVSDKYAEVFGVPVDDLPNKLDHELVDQAAADALQAAQFQAIAKGKEVTSEPLLIHDDRWTAAVAPIRNDDGKIDALSIRLT